MQQDVGPGQRLIDYLLGKLSEDEMLKVEETYFADEETYDRIEDAERDLIDKYVRGDLSRADRERFEAHFLLAPGRRAKVEFAALFNAYLNRQEGSVSLKKPKGAFWSMEWMRPALKPGAVAAVTMVALLAVGASIWRAFFYESPLSKGTAALESSFRGPRPVETRVSGLSYGPFISQKGGDSTAPNNEQLELAGRILLGEVLENPSPASRHALGRYYLARREFEKAIEQLNEAVRTGQPSAEIYSDLGAALLEKWKRSHAEPGDGEETQELEEAFEYLGKALEIDGNNLSALFNRALALESMNLTSPAQQAWQQYLERDGESEWAAEAREHLNELQQKSRKTSLGREEMIDRFLTAAAAGDDETAWKMISENRDLTGSFIENRLIDDYLEMSAARRVAEANEKFRLLAYAARMEVDKGGDRFMSDLLKSYRAPAPARVATLAEARGLLRKGKELLDASDTAQALTAYGRAKALFVQAGNLAEATYSQYPMGHCYLLQSDVETALATFSALAQTCATSGYRWLLAQSLNAKANAQVHLKQYSWALKTSQQSLEISEAIGDANGAVKTSSQIAQEYLYLNNYRKSLAMHRQCLELLSNRPSESIQRWRSNFQIAQALYFLGLYSAALEHQMESLRLAKEINITQLISRSYTNLALLYAARKDYRAAESAIGSALEAGASYPGERARAEALAYSFLQLGSLYRQAGDCQRAIESFDKALKLYDSLGSQAFTYLANKWKLLCCLEQGGCAAVDDQLATTLEMFEQHRTKILEESNKNVFFDVEQSVYDAAIEFQHSVKRDRETAFGYSEACRARSLYDMSQSERLSLSNGHDKDVVLPEVSRHLSHWEIQQRMPDRAQIVQYALLKRRLIIWVVSKDRIQDSVVEIDPQDLSKRVKSYLRHLSFPSVAGGEEMSRLAQDLYTILVKPVELLIDRSKQTCIVPDKILNYLPFAALISPDSGQYLVKELNLVYSPSSTMFIICSESARSRNVAHGERLLAVGNPAFDGRKFSSLEPLPSAEAEAEQVAQYYEQSRLFVRGAATESLVTGEMERSDVIHLALHAVTDEANPARSKLILAAERPGSAGRGEADGVLEVFELYNLNLARVRLVVLSACRTGVERFYDGEGMIGISRPFLAKRVPLTVASFWPVDSVSSAKLMAEFHRARKLKNSPTSAALAEAQVRMLEGKMGNYQHPYYWAAFTTIGGHGEF